MSTDESFPYDEAHRLVDTADGETILLHLHGELEALQEELVDLAATCEGLTAAIRRVSYLRATLANMLERR